MYKSYYLLLCFLMIVSCNNPEKKPQDLDKENRSKISKLSIKSLKVFQYDYLFGRPNKSTEFLIQQEVYDNYGNTISEISKVKNDSLDGNHNNIYKYDDKNNLIEKVEKNLSGKVTYTTRNIYQNQENTERLFFDSEGKPDGKMIFSYINGNESELTSYDKNGTIEYKRLSEYDSNGYLMETKQYDEHGKLDTRVEFKNDESQNEYTVYRSDTLYFKASTKLNSKKQPIETKLYSTYNKKTTRTVYRYNSNDLLSEVIDYDYNNEPLTLKKFIFIK